jgi:hypothetical protein
MTEADKAIVVGEGGVITIPVAACSSPKSTEKIRLGVRNYLGRTWRRPCVPRRRLPFESKARA